jgi:hypothetical protein
MMGIDLNLLKVFEIVYDERNVTWAAARLFLTQSAASHALAWLSDVLGDPLFIRILRACSRSDGSREVPEGDDLGACFGDRTRTGTTPMVRYIGDLR